MEYKIITAYNTSILARDVNCSISNGWIPTGGVAVIKTVNPSGIEEYHQAMIRNTDDRD